MMCPEKRAVMSLFHHSIKPTNNSLQTAKEKLLGLTVTFKNHKKEKKSAYFKGKV